MHYDKTQVQNWLEEVEKILDKDINEWSHEEQSIYNEINTRYENAEEIINDVGMCEEACYEIEQAYEMLDWLGYELQLITEERGLSTDYDE